MERVPQRQRVRSGGLARASALLLCLLLIGGRGLPVLLDALRYPHGACCCERAHGAAHHCRCATPHDGAEADAVHAREDCPGQWDEGGDEYGVPNLIAYPQILLRPAVTAPPLRARSIVLLWPAREPMTRGSAPPPVPPPISLRSFRQV